MGIFTGRISRFVLVSVFGIAAIGVSDVSAKFSRLPAVAAAFCPSNFLPPGYAHTMWGNQRYQVAADRMADLLRSKDGKVEGATKAALIDPKKEYDGAWTRDNANVVEPFMEWFRDNDISISTLASREDYSDIVEAYIRFCRSNLARDMRDIPIDNNLPADVREALRFVNGEPKFNADGTTYKGWWGRPQNDGPAYRALRWMEYVGAKLDKGDLAAAYENYSPDLKNLSVKWDLEYLAHHWRSGSFDLWEEELGTNTHTLIMIHSALEKGAELADRMHDPKAAEFYREQTKQIREKLEAEAWDEKGGYIRATWNHGGGFVRKKEPLDIAVIIGILHSRAQPPIFELTDDRVMATMETLERRFSELYLINRAFADPKYRGVAAIGRYPEDVFHGGNPWVIATQTAAEYYFRLGAELKRRGRIEVTERNRKFYARLLGVSPEEVELGTYYRGGLRFEEIAKGMAEKGDGFLSIAGLSKDPNAFQAEQIGRGHIAGDSWNWVKNYLDANHSDGKSNIEGGEWIGAQMLVWNEASFMSAWKARKAFLGSPSEPARPALKIQSIH